MIYAVSDIHGEYELFKKLLEKIDFSDKDEMYILGDVIDRGPEPLKLLHLTMEKDNIYLLMGNHEMMALQYYLVDRNYSAYQMWMQNGGHKTWEEFEDMKESEFKDTIEYLRTLPLMNTVKVNNRKFRLVHAGLFYDEEGNISHDQDINFMIWDREEFIPKTYIGEDTVIFGHTPHKEIHHYPGKKICIDCGATFYGKLGCLRLDDMEEIYVEKE